MAAAVHYTQQLFDAALWPQSRINVDIPPSTIPDHLRLIVEFDSIDFPSECTFFDCGCERRPVRQLFTDAVKRILKETKGLCLCCVKQGRITQREGNCRAVETDCCSGPCQ